MGVSEIALLAVDDAEDERNELAERLGLLA